MAPDAPDAAERLDQAPCGLLQTSEDGLFRAVNRTFCSWVGYATDELVRKLRFQDLLTMGSKITVTSTIGTRSCSIAVHNAGRPIPPELQSTLFEPLTRGPEAGHAARSIGLGLFIVREIARAHGGQVEVRSGAETGTTFEATWPQPAP